MTDMNFFRLFFVVLKKSFENEVDKKIVPKINLIFIGQSSHNLHTETQNKMSTINTDLTATIACGSR